MRDRRFIAAHRGGPLCKGDHQRLAAWAADVAESVIGHYESRYSDKRPRVALETARAWAWGGLEVGAAQKASLAAHAAAREADDPAAIAAARAAGHAVATAHMAEHALGSVIYGAKSVSRSPSEFLTTTLASHPLPHHLAGLVQTGLSMRLGAGFHRN